MGGFLALFYRSSSQSCVRAPRDRAAQLVHPKTNMELEKVYLQEDCNLN